MALQRVLFERESEGGMGRVVTGIVENQISDETALHSSAFRSLAEPIFLRSRLMLLLPCRGATAGDPMSICVQVTGVDATVFEDEQQQRMDRLLCRVREPEQESFLDIPRTHEAVMEILACPVMPWRPFVADLVQGELFHPMQDRFLIFYSSTQLLLRLSVLSTLDNMHGLYAMMWRSSGTWVLEWVLGDDVNNWPMQPNVIDADGMRDLALQARRRRDSTVSTVPPAPPPPPDSSNPSSDPESEFTFFYRNTDTDFDSESDSDSYPSSSPPSTPPSTPPPSPPPPSTLPSPPSPPPSTPPHPPFPPSPSSPQSCCTDRPGSSE